ncbi:MAG: HPF/RaiA family ribosome-associated protein [Bacteroidetes bacterium]|nr:HPF/RaiA family ribosome-associated protein [Pseudopedobacter sp.]MBU1373241.1 HPF/RaiA family ribosome-associated protein [Bacteroidota bacterium]MBU1486313.1 HPF/RaiA family ribosome-associated protein [Bacteroidota bacterium]MBU2046734.1 HPF/RaiA family ribosome-associated protein [Bacteroidota bacterium]MBU2269271.1 HPF/RaiA family ribosome-associated protein [Bacteroidota bacterium]
MTIQVNTDNHIEGKEELITYISNLYSEKLSRFDAHVTRIEIHLSDENAGKAGSDDKKCNVEARLEGHDPIFASAQSDEMNKAVHEGLHKIKRAIEHSLDRAKA